MTTSEVSPEIRPNAVRRNLPGLPMPQDLGLVFELARRPRLARTTRGRFPFPIPNGWFIVAASGEVAPGDVALAPHVDRAGPAVSDITATAKA